MAARGKIYYGREKNLMKKEILNFCFWPPVNAALEDD
jgi:hypothetical protein